MCGLAGLIWGTKKRSVKEREYLEDAFTRLLLLSEHRGPHATGVAWVKADGTHRIEKGPLPARSFVQTPHFVEWLNGVDDQVNILMGHTRWPTRGNERNPANNHPLTAGSCLLTHNGHIRNADELFRLFRLPRLAQVDSEVLVQLASRHAAVDGIDLDALLVDIALLDGRMSAVIVSTDKPCEVVLLKGNQPLELRYHARYQVLAYASEDRILDTALTGKGWAAIDFPPFECRVIQCHALKQDDSRPFTFAGQQQRGGENGYW